MSRTYRRNRQYLIDHWVGRPSEMEEASWWLMSLYPTLTLQQAYDRHRTRYRRDHASGHYGVPRHFRRLHGSKRLRTQEAIKLHRGMRSGEWDNHLPESRARNAAYYWF